jgi:hypothetical protein
LARRKVVNSPAAPYTARVNRLTKHEQLVLCGVFGLLLVGLAVKAWRQSQAEPATVATSSSTNGVVNSP